MIHNNTIEIIKENSNTAPPLRKDLDFSKIKVGLKTLEDAVVDINPYKKANPRLGDRESILRAIASSEYKAMREISDFFYRTSGIYSRLCRYMAFLYKYDWILTPYINDEKINKDKVLAPFNKILNFLDNFQIKKFLGEVALKVIKFGCYYGYIVHTEEGAAIQELPPQFCRSRFTVNGRPAIEFNVKFFDMQFPDIQQRIKVLNLFPLEFRKAYRLYAENKLKPDFQGDTSGWFLLDTDCAIKFNLNGNDYPAFISVIPAIIDLEEAKELDKKRMEQRLLKIIIQQMPLDKNGDMVFDMDEAAEMHNGAVRMLGKAIGVDVLTTYADTEVADLAEDSNLNTDDLERVERAVYNEAGVSQMQFNTNGNLALEKSILNDEAAMSDLIAQFENFLNCLIKPFNTNKKKFYFRVQILRTTIYNYKDLAKIYKEQTQLGYSKMLPQIALGQSQSSVLANAYFENNVLDLVNLFIPPIMSSTMNADTLSRVQGKSSGNSEGEVGRKEKPDDEKSEKTIQNRESMN